MSDPVEQFAEAIASAGLPVPPKIEPDGAFHRYSTNGKPKDDAGWYFLHLDGLPAGAFGCLRSGLSLKWHAQPDKELTAAERREYRRRLQEVDRQRQEELARRHAEAAARAADLWNKAQPVDVHPYLSKKGVQAHGIRTDGARLVIPMRDADGKLWSLQYIDGDGGKRYLTGGKAKGCYHPIGTPNGVIYIAEGYATAATVHEVTGEAVACAFNAGNLRPVAETLRAKLPEVRIIIAGDNDVSGTGQQAAEQAARASNGLVALPSEPGDWNDIAASSGEATVRAGLAAQTQPTSAKSEADWPEPVALPEGLPPFPEFDYALLLPVMRRRVEDIAERMQCPPDFPAVALMVMLSSVVGRRCGIHPKRHDDWLVIPNLWGMAIGRPGIMKTPAIDEVLKPIRLLQAKAIEQYELGRADYEAEQLVRDQSKRVAKDAIKAALKKKDRAGAADLAMEATQTDVAPPICERFIVNDSTVEKLGEILSHNPNGLMLFRDELAGFFRTLERQGHEADRAFYLEAWNGDGDYTYDRIGRGTLHVPAVCLSVLGSIQPGPLTELVRGVRGGGDDGLLQRFQLAVWPDASREWRNIDRRPDLAAREDVQSLIQRLAAIAPDSSSGVPALRFDDAGQELFDQWRSVLERRLREDELHPMLEAHLSKYRSLVPSIALLTHLAGASDGFAGPISEDSLIRAIAWAEYLEPHANRIYSPAISREMDAARALASKIREGAVGREFTLRDIYNNGWSGLATRDDVAAAVGVLDEYDWLRQRQESTAGRMRTVCELNPLLGGKS